MNEIIEYEQPLKDDELSFVIAYLQCFNASQAARDANIAPKDGDKNTSTMHGYRMMNKPAVIAAIEKHFRLQTMSAAETLARLTEQARGEYAQYITSNGSVNLTKMEEDNKLHLIKSIKKTKWGVDVTFADPQVALALMAKHHNLLTDKGNKDDNSDNKPPTYILIEQPST